MVGLGEATHGTHEFVSFKQRVFEYLVKEKGFTTFMLELNWGTGLQLNDYVLYGIWAEQQANVAFWIAKTHAAEDFAGPRDEAMALNTVWWLRYMKSKIAMSAHNAHVGYLGEFPPHTFKRQGTWLREILGPRYVAIGTSFYEGTFTALDENTGFLRRLTVGRPEPVNAERVLNRVRYPKYYLDMRTVDEPARSWLREEHQVRYITAVYSPTAVEENNIEQSLGRTYSILVQMRDTTPTTLVPGIPLGPQT